MKDKTRQFAEWLAVRSPCFRQVNADRAEALIRGWWAAWQSHPLFEECVYSHEPHNPVVQLVVEHEPGVGGRTRSYLIGSLCAVTSPQHFGWADKHFGRPVAIEPISADHPVSIWYVSTLSYSYRGKGKGYWARVRLKELLPKKLHRLITIARRLNRMPKYKYLPPRETGQPRWSKENWPDWYRRSTKADLALEQIGTLYPEDVPKLYRYMDPLAFWRCATGQVHPDDIAGYVDHQLTLFDMEVAT